MTDARAPIPGRNRCLVPTCGRSFKMAPGEPEGFSVICGRHWRLASAELRARYRELNRLYRRRPTEALRRMIERAFWACADEALQLAAGQITDASVTSFLEAL